MTADYSLIQHLKNKFCFSVLLVQLRSEKRRTNPVFKFTKISALDLRAKTRMTNVKKRALREPS